MDFVPTPPVEEDPVKDVALFAALAYIPFFSIFLIKYRQDSTFMRTHARQALVIFIFWVVNNIAIKVFPAFLEPVFYILNIVFLVVIVIGIFAALTGKFFNLPLVSSLAERIVA
jgi:uncharacterized membrane protein